MHGMFLIDSENRLLFKRVTEVAIENPTQMILDFVQKKIEGKNDESN